VHLLARCSSHGRAAPTRHTHPGDYGISRNRAANRLWYRPPMALRRRDLVALLLAAVTALAGLTAWAIAPVELGLILSTSSDGRIHVSYVAPGSIAASQGFAEGQLVTNLQSIDLVGMPGEPVQLSPEVGGGQLRLPSKPLPEWRIRYVETGFVEGGQVYPGGPSLYRPDWELRLGSGGWLLFVGAVIGAIAAFAAGRSWLGPSWREEGIVLGAAVALPFVATPCLYTGAPAGIAAAYLLPAAGTLPLARSLAERLTIPRWPATLFGASVVAAVTVGLTILRGLNTYGPLTGNPFDRVPLLAFITILPAAAAAFGVQRASRERTELLLVGFGPAAAAAVLGSASPNPAPLLGWLVIALGWKPALARIRSRVGRGRRSGSMQIETQAPIATEPEETAGWRMAGLPARDLAALGVAFAAALGALVACCDTWPLIVGSGLGGAVGLALRGGFLGPAWRVASIPVACAVAVPVLSAGLASGGGANSSFGASVLSSLSALSVAHLLGERHPDRQWGRIAFLLAVGLAAIAISSVAVFPVPGDGWYASGLPERYLLMGLIALVPGLVVAFSRAPAGGARVTDRLDTLVVALTPGAAMTTLVPSFGPVLLLAYLIGLVAWRRLTIAPLLGLAQRTQRQRDLAVAAVEAERARLAADLHDDALQELSALVRRLDAAGDTEGADLARGVAERLRSITSDLRLPLLDDLGAGPALEWLVGRVRPLAAGPVVLERIDPDRPPAGVELAVFRVAQEALANAVKHGRPPITVRYRVAEDGGVSLSVDDSGPGIEVGAAENALQAGHLGMANMQQRAEQIGALLDVRRWPAGGTHVAFEWRPQ
jgi:signal transduction histidine kinase